MLILTELAGIVGLASIMLLLVFLGLLSRKLGQVTEAASYYVGFFVGAALVGVGILVRILNLVNGVEMAGLNEDTEWGLLYTGLPALGVTLGVLLAWRYWSWLLADRD